MKWTRINPSDLNTYPPLNKRVYWYRSNLDCRTEPFRIFGRTVFTNGKYVVDGRYIDDGDYWIDIPDPL